ncbi:hypothetical protein JCM5353_007534 [Sporobolomyces roseus]
MAELTPAIQTRTILLPLANASLLPFPLVLQLVQLSSKSIMAFVSTPPMNQSNMMKDTSVAMPNSRHSNNACPSTSLSKSTNTSLSLSSRLAKRYKVQIFVSLDLSALSEILAGGGIATIEMVLLEMEKSLIKELDKMLPREKK